ncbi:MAG TPA: M1 family metallopeptidase [Saprospiraceae bacterium]|nr:M1 family metallopeptidase [Saprospiraceae bacterium]
MKSSVLFLFFIICSFSIIHAQERSNHGKKFEQLDNMLRSPNEYRGADGAPGPKYWQQKADYKINCTLDTKEQRIDGSEVITYYNNSPVDLPYLWVQLDENEHQSSNTKHHMNASKMFDVMNEGALERLEATSKLNKYGVNIKKVVSDKGTPLKYIINESMMRIDLPTPLKAGKKVTFRIDWSYYMIDRMKTPSWGRGGFEYFEDNKNYLYTVVQWFPRMCVYSDFEGWQNKQFLGTGEFALTFGDYEVNITLPSDHIVAGTGECQNYKETLTPTQYNRWTQAQTAKTPLLIVNLDEAKANEKTPISTKTKTWKYKAKNVRDFAWTASKKFAWDAMPHYNELGQKVMCMSLYGKEAYPIYNKYSTKVIDHTLKTYSKYSIPYPYPVAISVEAANGMEYPMISFNPGRAEDDGTYTEGSKRAAILVIIHEVGHTYFPMIINSDERQWAWFDEGINSFVQFLTEQEWDNDFKSEGGVPHNITEYMSRPKNKLEPIMTNSENIIDYGNNAYDKPATAINILRETIMGRELFDYAFKEYCRRWAFKHPTPDDFFRTMEEASAMDLDWYWRGWFYSIDAVDISLDSIKWYKADLENDPEKKIDTMKNVIKKPLDFLTRQRNRAQFGTFPVEKDSTVFDFYNTYRPWETEDSVDVTIQMKYDSLFTQEEKQQKYGDKNYYELHFSNKGGLVMPVIIEWTFEDGSKEVERVPVEIWRKNEDKFTKVFVKKKEVTSIIIDPYKETADIDESNNNWPVKELPTRFQLFKQHKYKEKLNPMQKAAQKELKP